MFLGGLKSRQNVTKRGSKSDINGGPKCVQKRVKVDRIETKRWHSGRARFRPMRKNEKNSCFDTFWPLFWSFFSTPRRVTMTKRCPTAFFPFFFFLFRQIDAFWHFLDTFINQSYATWGGESEYLFDHRRSEISIFSFFSNFSFFFWKTAEGSIFPRVFLSTTTCCEVTGWRSTEGSLFVAKHGTFIVSGKDVIYGRF